MSYRTADQEEPDFDTHPLKECDPGDSDERKKYDTLLRSSDKIYCPDYSEISEMHA